MDSVRRLLTNERCADSRTKDGGDIYIKKLLPVAESLSSKYGLAAVNRFQVLPRYSSRQIGNLVPSDIERLIREIEGLAKKVAEGGSESARKRIVEDLGSLSSAKLSSAAPAADFIMRAGTIARLSESFGDKVCEQAAIEDLFSMLRQTEVKRHEPAAWLVAVRYALNLSKSPRPELSRAVIQNWRAVSADREMQAYWEIDRQFGLLSGYAENTGSHVGALFAKF
jgi:hypothetical protein